MKTIEHFSPLIIHKVYINSFKLYFMSFLEMRVSLKWPSILVYRDYLVIHFYPHIFE